mgnify:CR=1 FL=1
MLIKKSKNLIGLTLIEVLVYLALFGMFFTVMIQFFFFVNDSNQLSGETLKLDRSVIFITQHLEDSFKKSTEIIESPSVPATVFNDDNGILNLTSTTNLSYSVNSGTLTFNGVDITRSDITVSKFYLEKIRNSSDTETIGVRITLNLVANQKAGTTKEFSTTYFIN